MNSFKYTYQVTTEDNKNVTGIGFVNLNNVVDVKLVGRTLMLTTNASITQKQRVSTKGQMSEIVWATEPIVVYIYDTQEVFDFLTARGLNEGEIEEYFGTPQVETPENTENTEIEEFPAHIITG